MKGLFIINPNSGMQLHQNMAHNVARTLLRDGVLTEARFVYTAGKNCAHDTAASAKRSDYDFIMAVGGDGTVNETASGIMDGGEEIPLAILSAGTSNDFAMSLGIPGDEMGLVRMIKEYCVRDVDIGMLNDKYFLNVAAGGILSDIAHSVSPEQKTALGRLAYYIEGAKTIGELRLDTVPLRFETGDMTFEAETFLVFMSNSRSAGGFRNVAPRAILDDGKFDVCIIKSLKPVDLVPLFTQIQMGTHISNNKCVTYFQTDRLKITPVDEDNKLVLDYDGECGDMIPAEIRVIKNGIKLLVPSWKRKAKAVLEVKE